MAQIIRQRTVTIPANTAKSSLYSVDLELPNETQLSIGIQVPSGPVGLMGFYLALSDQQVIPFESGQFIIWNDHIEEWDLSAFPTTGDWQVHAYNLDEVYDHSIFFVFHDDPLDVPTVQPGGLTIISSPVLVSPVTF